MYDLDIIYHSAIFMEMTICCYMFYDTLILCVDFSKSYNDFSFQKVHIFKTNIIKTAEKEPTQWLGGDDWLSLHYILGCEAYELHF